MSLEQLLAEMETLAQLLLFQLADTEVKKNFTDQDKAALIEARNHLRLAYNRANGKWAGGETSDVRKIKEILSGVLSNESSSAILATVINHKPAHQSMVVIQIGKWAGGETSDVRKIKEILSGVLSNESSSAILATVINHKPAHQSMVVI